RPLAAGEDQCLHPREGSLAPVRRPLTALAVVVLLAGPTALAFFTGGYFEGPRLTAGITAAAIAALAALIAPRVLPQSRSGRIAIAGMVLLVAWVGVSIAWAPVRQDAYGDFERLVMYLAVLVCAAALLRGRAALSAVEPALAMGAAIVVTYGLSERLLPGVLHFQRSLGAAGRLEQPLTYWNAMGALAAMGMVLCARLAGDATRAVALRTAAVALPRRALLGAAVPIVVLGLIALGGLVQERHKVTTYLTPAANSQRLVSLTNDRYAYWGVALDAFAAHPLNGVGSGGFREEW